MPAARTEPTTADGLRWLIHDLESARHALIAVALDTDAWGGITLADLDRKVDRAIERLQVLLARGGAMDLAAYDASLYPRPSVAVDVVLLTVAEGSLRTLLVRRSEPPQLDWWALPGGFVHLDESLDDAARRVLEVKAGLRDVFIEQLYTFGDPGRDPRTRVISIVYYALVEPDRLERAVTSRDDRGIRMAAVGASDDGVAATARDDEGDLIPLAFDHASILAVAVARIQGKLDWAPIGFELLPETFTLLELRRVHEAILGRPLNKDSFRRKLIDRGLVEPTGRRATGLDHRPPELYRFVREHAVGRARPARAPQVNYPPGRRPAPARPRQG